MKDILIDALVDLYQNGPRSEVFGICCHVQQYIEANYDLGPQKGANFRRDADLAGDLMAELFKRWPEFTGSAAYPVPGPKGLSPVVAFNTCIPWSGFYGAKRWALAEFMLRELCK